MAILGAKNAFVKKKKAPKRAPGTKECLAPFLPFFG